jgi:hypothetical protein
MTELTPGLSPEAVGWKQQALRFFNEMVLESSSLTPDARYSNTTGHAVMGRDDRRVSFSPHQFYSEAATLSRLRENSLSSIDHFD